jgi:hypothetical protein
MAGQLSIYIRGCHGTKPEGESKRHADEHVVTYVDADGHLGCRRHATPRLTGSHCNQANASARRGWDYTPTDSGQWYTKSAAANASCTANWPTKSADHATYAARVAVLSTDTCSIQ